MSPPGTIQNSVAECVAGWLLQSLAENVTSAMLAQEHSEAFKLKHVSQTLGRLVKTDYRAPP